MLILLADDAQKLGEALVDAAEMVKTAEEGSALREISVETIAGTPEPLPGPRNDDTLVSVIAGK